MTGWLNLTNEQRKASIDQAEQLSGISAKAIEKDWWVTLTLKGNHSVLDMANPITKTLTFASVL